MSSHKKHETIRFINKKISFSYVATYTANDPCNGVICESSMLENLTSAIEHMRVNGELTPDDISVSSPIGKMTIMHQFSFLDLRFMDSNSTKIASNEGWGVFETESPANKSSDALLSIEIQADSELDLLKNDNQAWSVIIENAVQGSLFHNLVINGIKTQSPEEYKFWINPLSIRKLFEFKDDFSSFQIKAHSLFGL